MLSFFFLIIMFCCIASGNRCAELSKTLQSNKQLFVLFNVYPSYARRCKLCEKLENEIIHILKKDFLTIHYEDCPELFKKFNIYFLPTFMQIKDGKLVKTFDLEREAVDSFIYSAQFPIKMLIIKHFTVIALSFLLIFAFMTGKFTNAIFCLLISGVMWNFKNNSSQRRFDVELFSRNSQIQANNEPYIISLIYFSLTVLLERNPSQRFACIQKFLILFLIGILSFVFTLKFPTYPIV